jgi:SAM-dependent methyltransferase
MRVLDAGCGSGRNLVYFLRSGYEVFGVDESEEAIAQVRRLAAALAPQLPAENFRVGTIERLSFRTGETKPSLAAGLLPRVDDAPATTTPAGLLGRKLRSADDADKSSSDVAGFDVVLSSAVLHFARDEQQWHAMVEEMWRVLKPGGIFFARLASTIGMENQLTLIEGRRYRLPDGSDRFLVDERMLQRVTAALGGEFIEPIKTTVVKNMRAMTTWVARRK